MADGAKERTQSPVLLEVGVGFWGVVCVGGLRVHSQWETMTDCLACIVRVVYTSYSAPSQGADNAQQLIVRSCII